MRLSILIYFISLISYSRTYQIKPIQLIRMSSHHSLNNFSKKIKVLILVIIINIMYYKMLIMNY